MKQAFEIILDMPRIAGGIAVGVMCAGFGAAILYSLATTLF